MPSQEAADRVRPLVDAFSGTVHVVKPRHSKWGDFRPSFRGSPARIRINSDLPAESFLVTLLHELAHAHVEEAWVRGPEPKTLLQKWGLRRRVPRPLPHGVEWQNAYAALLRPFLEASIFSFVVAQALQKNVHKPKASCGADTALLKALMPHQIAGFTVSDVQEGSQFRLENGRRFIKGPKRRTRFACTDCESGRTFAVHPLASALLIDPV